MTATEITLEDLAASTIKALTEEVRRLREERDAAFAAGFEAAKAIAKELARCGDVLSIAAQTTGGTPGPDQGLIDAIALYGKAREAYRALTQPAASDALAARGNRITDMTRPGDVEHDC